MYLPLYDVFSVTCAFFFHIVIYIVLGSDDFLTSLRVLHDHAE
jgi:hypothetical protein